MSSFSPNHHGITCWSNNRQEGGFLVRDSFNTSSVSDMGTGSQNTNFANNMANANYSAASIVDRRSGVRTSHGTLEYNPSPQTNYCRHEARNNNGGNTSDAAYHCFACYGDIA